jgi:hypothetical protein
MGGRPIKSFLNEADARNFLLAFVNAQHLHNQSLNLIDEAVDKSNLKESNEIIKHIMELKC